MSYGIDGDLVPRDGYPYIADLCPTCHEVRPFRIEEDDDGQGSATCATCGHAYEYNGMDSPGTSPEADNEDEPTDDAAVWHANPDDAVDDLAEDELTAWCAPCGSVSTFAPDQNDEDELPVCQWCGCLMDGAADYT